MQREHPFWRQLARWNRCLTDEQRLAASWDLQWEDELGPEDQYTIPEAVVLIARMRGRM